MMIKCAKNDCSVKYFHLECVGLKGQKEDSYASLALKKESK